MHAATVETGEVGNMKHRFVIKEEREYLVEVETEEKPAVAREMAQFAIMQLFTRQAVADSLDDNMGMSIHLLAARALGSSATPVTYPINNLQDWVNYRQPTPQRCPECGNEEVQLSHNTLSFYCLECDQWFDEN